MKNKNILMQMLRTYGHSIDWMGFKITKKNYPSYHHIVEKRNGGKETISNGAILTKYSHIMLHTLEKYNIDLYYEWQVLFLEINANNFTKKTPFKIKKLFLKSYEYLLSLEELTDYEKNILILKKIQDN